MRRGAEGRARASVIALAAALAVASPVHAANEIRHAGDALQLALPAGALVLSLNRGDGTGIRQLLESVAVSTAITGGLKYTVHEERPGGGTHSFPSGHTTLSFCAAEFLQRRYGSHWGIPAAVLAAFVGYSRVQSKEHWTHDVLAGAVIGAGTSRLVTQPGPGWNVGGSIDPDGARIGAMRRF